VALCTTLACGATASGGGQALDVLAPSPYSDLETLVRDLFIPGAESDRYAAPSRDELSRFEAIVAMMTTRAFTSAQADASALGYDLWRLDDPASHQLVVLVERPATARGGGTYVLDTGATSRRVIEVPHPLSDLGTLNEGVQLFKQARAGALLIAGTHRCASLKSTPCFGAEATNVCSGRIRLSDAAHFDGSFFHHAHAALFRSWSTSAAVSLHAHLDAAGQPDLTTSVGTREPLGAEAAPNTLRDALRAAGFSASSCNGAGDTTSRLCGESNVQGRFSNGVADACHVDATHAGARFLHLEQSASVLANPAPLLAALGGQL
jgi:hypothetical protein